MRPLETTAPTQSRRSTHGPVETIWLPGSEWPFASLAPLFEAAGDAPRAEEESRAAAGAERVVRRFLQGGGVVLIDDAEHIDKWSAGCLTRQRSVGAVVETFSSPRPDAIPLPELRRTELRSLFAGPERVVHLRHDAADFLHARTRGHPGRVAAELQHWLDAGLATRAGDGSADGAFRLTPRGHEGLDGSPRVTVTRHARPIIERLHDALDQLLAWCVLAESDATPELLQQLSGVPSTELLFQISELNQVGAVTFARDGTLRPLVPSRVLQAWTPDQRRAAHRQLAAALEAGSPSRLLHAIGCGDNATAASEAIARARRASALGRHTEAWRTVERALVAVGRDSSDSAETRRLLRALTHVALDSGDRGRLERARYSLSQAAAELPEVHLLDCAVALLDGDDASARTHLSLIVDDGHTMDRQRLGLAIGAAWKLGAGPLREAFDAARRWAAKADSSAHGWLAQWLARQAWEQGDAERAAELFATAAGAHVQAAARLEALVAAARARLAAGAWPEARSLAREALSIARLLRSHRAELDAELCLRMAGWLEGRRAGADPQLLAVLDWLPIGHHHPVAWLVEALHAHRAGDAGLALRLLDKAEHHWTRARVAPGGLTPATARPAIAAGRAPRGALPVVAPAVRGLYVPD